MQWVEYLRLASRTPAHRTADQQARFAALDREDERIGDELAAWEFPAVLALGGLLSLLLGFLA